MKFKSAKSVLSQYTENKLDSENLEKLHRVLFHMLKDIKGCCERHGLKYMLCGGSCLGAIRHKGFIPWDDDVDIMMLREDVQRLSIAIIEDYGDKYSVKNTYSSQVMNILLNGTTYKEIFDVDPQRRDAIYVDIFPIDNMPKGKRRLRAWRYFWAKHAIAFIRENKYPSPQIREIAEKNKEVASYYRKRRMLGKFFGLFGSIEHYNKVVNKLAEYKKVTGYLGIPCAISYNREKFRAEVLTETIDAEFCGETFKIPKFYDEYLTNLYGSGYMVLPPPEKREVHVSARIDFGKYGNLNEKGEFDE